MKNVLLLVSILFVLIGLSGCSSRESQTSQSENPKTEFVKPKTEELDDTIYSKTFTYERGTDVKQKGRETITYKNKEILTVAIQLTQPFDENTKANLKQYELQTVKSDIVTSLEKDEVLAQLLDKEGLTVNFDVSSEYNLIINMLLDMEKVNFGELKQIKNFNYDFGSLENMTPKRYIASLTIRGAKEISPNQ